VTGGIEGKSACHGTESTWHLKAQSGREMNIEETILEHNCG
jgi:hypothetical protein